MSDPTSPTSASSKARQKRYHRRSPRACDECRLRKCKCDGFNPCGPCRLTGNSCTYDPSTVPVQKPTLRVRELEARLRSVRDLVQDLRHKSSRDGISGLSSELAALEEAVGLSSPAQASPASQLPVTRPDEHDPRVLLSMMGTTRRKVVDEMACETSYGPVSIFSFICRNLELFQSHSASDSDTHAAQRTFGNLFNAKMLDRKQLHAANAIRQLPDEASYRQILDSAFRHCQPLGRLFHVSELREVVTQFYQPEDVPHSVSSACLYPLLHAVMSLEHLFDLERHQRNGCEEEISAAMNHFYTAVTHIDDIQDPSILGIQTLLCLVIILLNSSQLGKAHRILSLACSAAIRLGLPTSSNHKPSQKQQATELRVYSLLLEFDTYISILLDLPQILNVQDIQLKPSELNSKIARGAPVLHSLSSDEVEIELSRIHMHLMAITSKALRDAFHVSESWVTGDTDSIRTARVDERVLREADANFRAWVQRLGPLLAEVESTPNFQRFRPRLESTFYLSQLALYFPFLQYLAPSNIKKAVYSNQSQIALSCIKVASTTILRFSNLYETGDLLPACWTMVHAIFVAVLCLIFLIAAHEGTSRPGEAWRRAELGIRILASMRCADRGANACLDIIKLLITRLKHTVDFDMDQIESTTRRICDKKAPDVGAGTTDQMMTDHQGTSPSEVAQQHRPSFTIQDLLIPDSPTTTLDQKTTPVALDRTGLPVSHETFTSKAFQPSPAIQHHQTSATSTGLLAQQAQFLAQIPSISTWAASPSDLTYPPSATAAAIDIGSPPLLRTSTYEPAISLSTDADDILAQAQRAHTIDFDMLLDMPSS